ncbi:hypothetical protein [Brevundimonas nasdae]|nr:hypothetical protein [Brevundimonas nasdae]
MTKTALIALGSAKRLTRADFVQGDDEQINILRWETPGARS